MLLRDLIREYTQSRTELPPAPPARPVPQTHVCPKCKMESGRTAVEQGAMICPACGAYFRMNAREHSFFPSITFESFCYFRIAFAVSLTAHSQVHTNLSTFAHEVIVQVFNHFFVTTFSYTDYVFVYKLQTTFSFFHFFEFRSRSFTQRTLFGSCFTFVNVTTNCTDKLFHKSKILSS